MTNLDVYSIVERDGASAYLRRARALGGALKVARGDKGWAVESLAHEAGLGHMTVRRMERGEPVRAASYAAIDRLFNLPVGTIQQALGDDERMVGLARALGVDTKAVAEGMAPAAWVAKFATSMMPPSGIKQPVKNEGSEPLSPADHREEALQLLASAAELRKQGRHLEHAMVIAEAQMHALLVPLVPSPHVYNPDPDDEFDWSFDLPDPR